jgi:hypothetical protein
VGTGPALAHRLQLFKNEGLAPDAAKRLSAFLKS